MVAVVIKKCYFKLFQLDDLRGYSIVRNVDQLCFCVRNDYENLFRERYRSRCDVPSLGCIFCIIIDTNNRLVLFLLLVYRMSFTHFLNLSGIEEG